MRHLSVIHEGDNVNVNFIEAQRLINDCEKVRILGYGFHDTNNERLRLAEYTKLKDVWATAYGLSSLERLDIQNYLDNHIIQTLDSDNKRTIVRFFKEVVSLD